MSKRLQVVVGEPELRRFRKAARDAGLTLSEWARQALRSVAGREPGRDPVAKLAALQRATGHAFPAPDIERMLEEIETGHRAE